MSKRFVPSVKVTIGIVAVLAAIITSMFILPMHTAQAAPDDTSVMKKILANAIGRCYNNTYIHKDYTPAGTFDMEDIFVWKGNKEQNILILNDYGGKMSCKQVFLGSKKAQGLNSLFGKTPTKATELGYEQSKDTTAASTKCINVLYKYKSPETGQMTDYISNSLCFGITSSGIVDMDSFPEGGVAEGDCANPICLSTDVRGVVYVNWLDNYGLYNSLEVATYDTNMFAGGNGTKWDDLYNEISNGVGRIGSDQGYSNTRLNLDKSVNDPGAFAKYEITNFTKAAETVFKYYTGSSNMDSQKFTTEDIEYILNKAYLSMKSDGIITEDSHCFYGKDEALSQNTNYAKYNASQSDNKNQGTWCPVFLNTGLAAGKTYNVVASNLKDLVAVDPQRVLELVTDLNKGYDTTNDYCYANAQKDYNDFNQAYLNEKYNGAGDADKLKFYKQQMQEIRQIMNTPGELYKTENGRTECVDWPKFDPDAEIPSTSVDNNNGSTNGVTNNDPNSGNTGGTDSELAGCLNGASSLGWILCPVLRIVGETVDKVYSDIEQNWLPIDNNLISTTSGIYDAWKVFRDFANIAFVIMLILIVLSQITGFGISNYGIKKILPSLIVVAVLVNMSFLLCQLLVDVMNIVGAEVGGIFARIGVGNGTTVTGGTVVKGAIATVFSVAGITGLGITVGYTIVTNPGLLIPILIFGIGIIITLFFFYAILAIRKAGIYAMIILSPLAIVCYALPNTKSLFDRWKKLFTALLVVYPICQIVTGGGQMISGLMLQGGQDDGFVYNVVAIILSFAPIFLIPSLVKGSLTGLGNIGTKLSQTGSRLRGITTSKLTNSDTAKRLRTTGAYVGATQGRELMNKVNDKLRRAKVIGGLVRGVEDSKLGEAIKKQNARKDAQAKVAYRKMLMDDASAANISDTMTGDTIQNELAAQELKHQQDLVNNAVDGILSGRGEYTDATGATQAINSSNLDSLTAAWESYMNQYDATGDKNALLNAKALTQIMFENNGDKGRTRIMDKIKERNFNATTGVGHRTQSLDDLSQYINRNSKWMTGLKAADTGSYKLIGDVASGNNLDNLHAYNTAAHDKLNAGNVRDLGDSFFDGIRASNAQGIFNTNSSNFDQRRFDELATIRDTFARTMNDPRTAESIKPDMLREMNKINRIVYDGRYNQAYNAAYTAWQAQAGHSGMSMTDYDADYAATHGGRSFRDDFGHYKDLVPPP